MKITTIAALILLPFCLFGQIVFEEISAPVDYNINKIAKSPIGEYFTQPVNARNLIFSSLNGINWTMEEFSIHNRYTNILFLDDGTPILVKEHYNDSNNYEYEPLVRRNGSWFELGNFAGGVDVKGDSIFIMESGDFKLSLDRGETWEIFIDVQFPDIDDIDLIRRHPKGFLLVYGLGLSEKIALVNQDGSLVLDQGLPFDDDDLKFESSSCGEILGIGVDDHYHLIKEDFTSESGILNTIFPVNEFNAVEQEFLSAGENYYFLQSNTLHQISGCDYAHTIVADNLPHTEFSLTHQEEILLYDTKRNFILEKSDLTSPWEEKVIDIDYPFVSKITGATGGKCIVSTPNHMFYKEDQSAEYVKLDFYGPEFEVLAITGNGNIYVQSEGLFYSDDDGANFNEINLPDGATEARVLEHNLICAKKIYSNVSYTIDHGQTWIEIPETDTDGSFSCYTTGETLHLYVPSSNSSKKITINLATGEQVIEQLTITGTGWFAEDGTLYIKNNSVGDTKYFRYPIGGPLQDLGSGPTNVDDSSFFAVGKDLFALTASGWFFRMNQNGVSSYDVILPDYPSNSTNNSQFNRRDFYVDKDHYIYTVTNDRIIHKSSIPLVFEAEIAGTVAFDENDNCQQDVGEPLLQNWKIDITGDNYERTIWTNNSGSFRTDVPEGDFIVTATPISSAWGLCESALQVTAEETQVQSADFIAQALIDCADLDASFATPLLRRCFDNYYTVNVVNNGPRTSSNTILTIELDSYFKILSSDLSYTENAAGHLEYDLGLLELGEEINFKIHFNLSCDAELGALHCMNGTLTDLNICNNTIATAAFTDCRQNTGAYDPNDKRTFNDDGELVSIIDTSEYIFYHIRFQNTGTDTASTVEIVDRLSTDLDLSTFEMISASHENEFTIENNRSLEVIFNNIMLPDSTTNEVASHGYFGFKIKPIPNLAYGTTIPNYAAIYFDFNLPEITKESIVTLGIDEDNDGYGVEEDCDDTNAAVNPDAEEIFGNGIDDNCDGFIDVVSTNQLEDVSIFEIIPNPASNTITFRLEKEFHGQVEVIEIYSHVGQKVYSNNSVTNNQIDVSNFSSGVYSLLLRNQNGIIGTEKFVVIR